MQPLCGRVLCVDDDPDSCELIKMYLGLEDYEVFIARAVAEGLRLARMPYFDVFLIDERLPNGRVSEILCKWP